MTQQEAAFFMDLVRGWWPKDSVFRYFARNPKTGDFFGCSIDTPSMLYRTTNWADKNGYNSYWQINPTQKREGTRCSTFDITHWMWFPLDIDPQDTDADPSEAAWVYQYKFGEALALAQIPYRSYPGSLNINSGRGIQVLYRLPALRLLYPPATFDGIPLDKAVPVVMRHWIGKLPEKTRGCVIDVSCTDLPRVMRVPFTINAKTGERAFIIGDPPTDTVIDNTLDLFRDVDFHQHQPVVPRTELSGKHWMEYLPHLTVTARRFITEGAEHERHKAATAAMLSLIELGADREQVRASLRAGWALSNHDNFPMSEIDDMVDRRFRRGQH